jgi:hypothetical protein
MAKALNINVITKAVKAAFKAADTYDEQVAILQREFKGADRDAIKAIVCPLAATKYDAEYIDGQWVDSACAAKRYANRLIAAVMGTSSGASEPTVVRLPKALVSSITSEIIDAQLTKAQFDALLAQLRKAISFE